MRFEQSSTPESGDENRSEFYIGDPKYSDEVLHQQDSFLAENIVQSYAKKISELQFQLAEIKKYLTAKENEPELSEEISKLTDETTIDEKIREIENYKQIIQRFEEQHGSEEVVQNARKTIADLEFLIQEAREVRTAAKERPSLN
jgi:hypothetical protein